MGPTQNPVARHAIAVSVPDLTKKNELNVVRWSDACKEAFQTLKSRLSQQFVLRLSNLEEDFVLRTDGPNEGIGVVLLQGDEDFAASDVRQQNKCRMLRRSTPQSRKSVLRLFGLSRSFRRTCTESRSSWIRTISHYSTCSEPSCRTGG